MSKKYIDSVDVKTIEWGRLIGNEINFFSHHYRFPTIEDLLKDIVKQNNSKGFDGEDLQIKQKINELCESLISKCGKNETNSLEFFTQLIGLGEYLFSSNHQHFVVAQRLGIEKNNTKKKVSVNHNSTSNRSKGETNYQGVVDEYNRLKKTKNPREIAGIIASKLNLTSDSVRRHIRKYKKSEN
tara:strand:- start:341 stop:892 length:552 start_codon:yes stop_codon:yes gene_type:complete